MKIYLDILIIVNFICDFILMLSVSIMLKRNIKISRLILSSFVGTSSLIIIFVDINNTILFLLKLMLASLMIIIAFGYKDIKYFFNNLLYFFINSLIIGGFIYFINLKIKYNFIQNELFNNYLILVIFSPIILYIYIRACLKIKYKYSLFYKINIYVDEKTYKLNGYYDTGNVLKDPYKKRSIIIVNKNIFNDLKSKYLLVPIYTVDGSYLLKCFKPSKIYIDKVGKIDNVLIGLSKEKIKLEGIDCLINKQILEERI